MSDITRELTAPEPVELTDTELDQVYGGAGAQVIYDNGGDPSPDEIIVDLPFGHDHLHINIPGGPFK